MSAPKLERPSVEYNLTEHCNLSCYGCDHASPLLGRKFADLDAFARDLRALGEVFHAGEVRLVGGEPLLHPCIADFLREARSSGIAERVVVYTNGVLLHRMPIAFWEGVDDLRVSVYPGVRLPLGLEALAVICADRGIAFAADAKGGQFQQTLLNQPIAEPALTAAVFRACDMAGALSCHTVHEGRFYLCSIAPFQRPRLERIGMALENRETDGVRLHDNPTLRDDLERCLAAAAPLAACAFCLGSSAPWTAHRQADAAGLRAWMEEDHRPLVASVRRRLLGEAR